MPRYKKKITSLMEYPEFKQAIKDMSDQHQSFLTLLFFAGCRVSEALALEGKDIHCTKQNVFVQFLRLKGSRQTDPTELPRRDALEWLCHQKGRLFHFRYMTAYRIVKRAFPHLYPHYFRMNRITKTSDQFGDTTVYHVFGITANAIDHYRGKTDIKQVGKALREEMS